MNVIVVCWLADLLDIRKKNEFHLTFDRLSGDGLVEALFLVVVGKDWLSTGKVFEQNKIKTETSFSSCVTNKSKIEYFYSR
jgi:hypothetical protein